VTLPLSDYQRWGVEAIASHNVAAGEEIRYIDRAQGRSRVEWAHTIETGLDCMLGLWHHNGGTLIGDLGTATLHFHPPVMAAS
jgi:hypothetical protein